MIEPSHLVTAFVLGLSGGGHCLGMCGGIVAALQMGSTDRPVISLCYHIGRIVSYALLGAVAGILTALAADSGPFTIVLRYLAGMLLIVMGLYVAGWWHGMLLVERAGARLFAPVQRWSSQLLPLRTPAQAFALGLCWALLPCGLIYSSLAWSATLQSPAQGAAVMLVFGLGTLPAMLAVSLGAARVQAVLRQRNMKHLLGALLVLLGIWSVYITHAHSTHAAHSAAHPAVQQQPAQTHGGHRHPD